MLSDLLRTIGAACIIAGAFLFFNGNLRDESSETNENNLLKTEIKTLQTTLERTKVELADLQLASAAEDNLVAEQESPEEINPEVQQIIKTVLVITPGMDSSTAALVLERAGIIMHASNLEGYLLKNNLTGKVQIGEYELDSSMANETIAAIITKTN